MWREGWSQEDIGKALGVDHWTVGRWTSNWGQSLNAQTRIEPSCGKTPQEAITELPPRTNTRGQQRPRKYKPRKPKTTFVPAPARGCQGSATMGIVIDGAPPPSVWT